MKRIAIVGGGISGVAAALECCRAGGDRVECVVFEAADRAGGTVLTRKIRLPNIGDFIMELGPDGWVTEKPWASRLSEELGLASDLVASNDAQKKIYLLQGGRLEALPTDMRLMVPSDLDAIRNSPLLSDEGKRGYLTEPDRADELRSLASSQGEDISVAEFVRRHFGEEATRTFAAPLLAGIFGGDVERLSARSVLPQFCAWEREHGSLVRGLQISLGEKAKQPQTGAFTALRGGNESLLHAIAARLPAGCLQLKHPVTKISRDRDKWKICVEPNSFDADAVLLATPAHITAKLLADVDERLAQLHTMHATSGTLAALLFDRPIELPAGFGFLVNQPQAGFHPAFLACTFSHQKYPHCTPSGAALLRVFFGGAHAAQIGPLDDAAVGCLALEGLRKLFPSLPAPAMILVQRWPQSLPQYEVSHQARVAEIEQRVLNLPGLFLLGNAYRGVGLPDMVAMAQQRARLAIES